MQNERGQGSLPADRTKWQLGGYTNGLQLTDVQLEALRMAADLIIPPGDGFPAPSEVRVVEDFMVRYIAADGEDAKYFPMVGEDQFKNDVDALAKAFRQGQDSVAALRDIENERPAFFEYLRGLLYFGYYSRPQVVLAIRSQLEAGRDYRGPPQPYGYLDVIEDWSEDMTWPTRGSYTPTDAVRSVGDVGPKRPTLIEGAITEEPN